MLTLFRNLVRSKYALIVIGLLILAMAAFGITDIFTPGLGSSLARVGDRPIEVRTIDREMDLQLDRINEQTGQVFTRQDFADSGRLMQTIAMEVNRTTMAAYLEQEGLRPSEKAVQDQIRQIPAFRSQINSGFDINNYQAFLNNQNIRESEFVQTLEDQQALDNMSTGFSGALDPPNSMAQLASAYRSETRGIAYIVITPDNLPTEQIEPTEEELRTFYTSQQGTLLQPERRAFSVIAITPDDYLHRVEVSDEEIENEYHAQISRFSAPSTRVYDSLVFPTEAAARSALGRLLADENITSVMQSLSGKPAPTESTLRSEIPNTDLADAIFSTPIDLWAGPVELVDGRWVIVRVNEEIAGEQQPLEAVSNILKAELTNLKAQQAYLDAFEEIDDAAGSGLTLSELANEIGTPLYSFPPVDNRGVTKDGVQVRMLVSIEGLLDYGFDLYPDETSFRQDAGETQFIIRLDETVDGYLPTFEDVKDDLVVAYDRQQQAQSLREITEGITTRLEQGGFLTSEADILGVDVVRPIQPLSRASANQSGFQQAAIEQIFAVGLDQSFVLPRADGIAVGVVESIQIPDASTLNAMAPTIKVDLASRLNAELENAVFAVAREEVKVSTNDSQIEAYIQDNQSIE